MKELDLDKAFNEEKPLRLRNGEKAFIIYKYPESLKNYKGDSNINPFVGYSLNKDNHATFDILWYNNGMCSNYISNYDIVGWWKEPISPDSLPNPFYPVDGDKYFYFSENGIECATFYETEDSDTGLAENGQCFRTKEDAQVWLDFMKSKLEQG